MGPESERRVSLLQGESAARRADSDGSCRYYELPLPRCAVGYHVFLAREGAEQRAKHGLLQHSFCYNPVGYAVESGRRDTIREAIEVLLTEPL